mmetsp:Transcript_12357/g.22476  ORF Transcript_12357/g.22476 Transcript_12357/m.22476 type:complete len:309 (+) Transcript_12357:24-950(+)
MDLLLTVDQHLGVQDVMQWAALAIFHPDVPIVQVLGGHPVEVQEESVGKGQLILPLGQQALDLPHALEHDPRREASAHHLRVIRRRCALHCDWPLRRTSHRSSVHLRRLHRRQVGPGGRGAPYQGRVGHVLPRREQVLQPSQERHPLHDVVSALVRLGLHHLAVQASHLLTVLGGQEPEADEYLVEVQLALGHVDAVLPAADFHARVEVVQDLREPFVPEEHGAVAERVVHLLQVEGQVGPLKPKPLASVQVVEDHIPGGVPVEEVGADAGAKQIHDADDVVEDPEFPGQVVWPPVRHSGGLAEGSCD